jgi:putative ABC transport system permease protein
VQTPRRYRTSPAGHHDGWCDRDKPVGVLGLHERMRWEPTRFRAIGSVAVAQLWHHRRRAALGVAGIAVAVLLITVVAGLGVGVLERGQGALDGANRDLWMSPDVEFAPGAVGRVENNLLDAHGTAERVQSRPEVSRAQAVSFQSVYIAEATTGAGPPPADAFSPIVGMGVTGTSAPIPVKRGMGFNTSDVHYNGGSYDGRKTNEAIVDQRAAEQLGVSVGDTFHVGGTIENAQANEFRVVGVSSGISSLVGAPTVILHLSELQALTGTTGSDTASMITITLRDGVDPERAAGELERAFPDQSVRTNSQQLDRILQGQTAAIVGTAAIVILAVVVGLALAINISTLMVYGQRSEIAALKAGGVSTGVLLGTTGTQGVLIGLLGGAIGLAGTPICATIINNVVARLTGISSLVTIRPGILLFGLLVAVLMGTAGAVVAGFLIARLSPLKYLE